MSRFEPKIVADALVLLKKLQMEDSLLQSISAALKSKDFYRLEGVLQQLNALGDVSKNNLLLSSKNQVESAIEEVRYYNLIFIEYSSS